MRYLRVSAAVALLLPFWGCVPIQSFYPLWDQQHTVSEPGLLGEWRPADPDEQDLLTIADAGGQRYAITYTENPQDPQKAKESRFDAHLVRLGEHLWLDFTCDEPSVEDRLKEETYQPLMFMHFFARVKLEGNSLKLAVLDDERFEKKARKEEGGPQFLKRGDDVLLTAETAKIQRFLERFATDEDLWGGEDDEIAFVRGNRQTPAANATEQPPKGAE